MDRTDTSGAGSTRPHFVFTSAPDPGVAEVLQARGDCTVARHHHLAAAELRAAAAAADVLVVRSNQRVDAAVLEAGSGRLRTVVQGSAGLDNIDAEAAGRLGIEVLGVDPGNATAVAELTLLSLLALLRRAPGHWEATRAGVWPDRERLDDRELRGKRLGIVGLGRIGRRVARRARAFEMDVAAVDPYLDDAVFAEEQVGRCADLASLLDGCDALTLHCPLTAETRRMIDAAALSRLPRGAVVVNTARGPILDAAAALSALDSGALAGLALDVFDEEPPSPGPLLAHPRVLPTPHLGGHTAESHAERARHLAEALDRLASRLVAAAATATAPKERA